MTSVNVETQSKLVEIQEGIESIQQYLSNIFDKASYIEARLDESQGKTSDLFRHIQQQFEDFDGQLGGAVQLEKNFASLFESFSKNGLLQGLSGLQKLAEFKVMVKAAQLESFETVCWKKF